MAEGAIFRNSVTNRYATSEAVLDAEVRIGQLMRDVPKETNNNPNGNNQHGGQNDSGVDSTKNKKKKQKSKSTVIREAGFTQKQAERFQQLASHPEIVEQAKAEARENDDIVSREGEALKRPIRITLYV